MNKEKQEKEKRAILNQIRHTSLSGNKTNSFQSYMSETESHIRKKFEVWLKLRKAGYQVWTEVIFNGGIRMDILSFKDGVFTNYEILENETIEKFNEKIKNYPPEITIIPIQTNKEIENLEMF